MWNICVTKLTSQQNTQSSWYLVQVWCYCGVKGQKWPKMTFFTSNKMKTSNKWYLVRSCKFYKVLSSSFLNFWKNLILPSAAGINVKKKKKKKSSKGHSLCCQQHRIRYVSTPVKSWEDLKMAQNYLFCITNIYPKKDLIIFCTQN